MVILLLFVPLIVILSFVVPSFISELPKLIGQLNTIIKTSHVLPEQFKSIDFTQYQQGITDYILHSTQKVTSYFITYITIIFLTIYIMIDFERLKALGLELAPAEKRKKIEKFMDEIIAINGHYIRGNILISIVCTSVITLGLVMLRIPNAVSLGIFAGIMDLLPLIGAVTGAVPAIVIGFAISPLTGILVTLLFIVYQQFENNILLPHIYHRVLNLSPAISFVAVLIGGALFGATGAFLALPIAASIPSIINFISSEMRNGD
jgi:predicted PurR-regulated permease PerM